MTDEASNESNKQGKETNTDTQDNQAPTSLYDKTEAIVQRQEAANKKTEELLSRQETLHANQRLAGTTGGRVEPEVKEVSDEDYAKSVMAGNVPDAKE